MEPTTYPMIHSHKYTNHTWILYGNLYWEGEHPKVHPFFLSKVYIAIYEVIQIFVSVMNSHMDVSENSGTPKSSILIGLSIINHPFWGTPIFGNTHMIRKLLSLMMVTYL